MKSAFILLFLLVFNNISGQILITSSTKEYHVIDESTLSISKFVLGKNTSQSSSLQYHFASKEHDYLTTVGKIGKKKLKTEDLRVSDSNHGFYNGIKIVSVTIPPDTEFEISHKTTKPGSVFLADITTESNHLTLQSKLTITLPVNWIISQRNNDLEFELIDSNKYLLANIDSLVDSLSYPILVHPSDTNPVQFFNDWFYSRITKLNAETNWTNDISLYGANSLETAKNCFEYVKQKIKYIDIEDGIGALIPFSCDVTMRRLAGDCKDMANVLTTLLKQHGIEAYNAVSRTNSLKDTFNFPSVALANHMISVAIIDDKIYYLDATENHCSFGLPSFQIQDTEIFILKENAGYFHSISSLVPSLSKVKLNWILSEDLSHLKFEGNFTGKANDFIQYIFKNTNKEKQRKIMKFWMNKELDNIAFNYSDTLSTITFIEQIDKRNLISTEEQIIIKHIISPDFEQLNKLFIDESQYLFPVQFYSTLSCISSADNNTSETKNIEFSADSMLYKSLHSENHEIVSVTWQSTGKPFAEIPNVLEHYNNNFKRLLISKSNNK